MAIEMVVPIEELADPIPIDFTFKCTNTNDATIYVKSELVTPPAGWNTTGAELHGALAIGVDNYFLNDNNTRDKPANLTEETVNLKISYYSDAGYTVLITSETLEYTITYVDFTDVSFTIVDDDTFETNLEGWAKVDESGSTFLIRTTNKSRTGVASAFQYSVDAGDVTYAHKSFAIGAVTRAFIRVWLNWAQGAEAIFELITDAGGANERIIKIAFDSAPQGGTEIMNQWVCIGLKIPVNGTYQVRLKVSSEAGDSWIYYDDIRVVQS